MEKKKNAKKECDATFEELKKSIAESKETTERQMARYEQMMQSFDATKIADHKAKIDEREYWRKLRGDVFLSVHRYCGDHVTYESMLNTTKYVFGELYKQDQEFFKDK